jgi:hypothetical protein
VSDETVAGDQRKRHMPRRKAAIVAAGFLLLLGVGALLIPRAPTVTFPRSSAGSVASTRRPGRYRPYRIFKTSTSSPRCSIRTRGLRA